MYTIVCVRVQYSRGSDGQYSVAPWSDDGRFLVPQMFLRQLPPQVRAALANSPELANVALLTHPDPNAPTALTTDDSDIAVGAVVEQRVAATWQPLAFFSCKLRDSVFDRQLLTLFLATLPFCFLQEGCSFAANVDNKPLMLMPWLT